MYTERTIRELRLLEENRTILKDSKPFKSAVDKLVEILKLTPQVTPNLAKVFFNSISADFNHHIFLDTPQPLKWLIDESAERIVKDSVFRVENSILIKTIAAEQLSGVQAWNYVRNDNKLTQYPLSAVEKGYLIPVKSVNRPVLSIDPGIEAYLSDEILSLDKTSQDFQGQIAREIARGISEGLMTNSMEEHTFLLDYHGLTPNRDLHPLEWNPN